MKKFVAILSIIFTFITIPCCFIYYMGSTSYVDKFFTEQMIPLMGTILALNFALVTSLQIFLLQIEDKFEKKCFISTRKEINSNIIALLVIFGLAFIMQCIDISAPKYVFYIFMAIKLTLFFLYIYAIYDLSSALFKVGKNS